MNICTVHLCGRRAGEHLIEESEHLMQKLVQCERIGAGSGGGGEGVSRRRIISEVRRCGCCWSFANARRRHRRAGGGGGSGGVGVGGGVQSARHDALHELDEINEEQTRIRSEHSSRSYKTHGVRSGDSVDIYLD